MNLKRKYRIVRDSFAGYEVQWRRPWMPFWLQVGFTNTHSTIEAAEAYAAHHAKHGRTVKYLGELT